MKIFKIFIFSSFLLASCSPKVNMEKEHAKLLQTDIEFSHRSAKIGNNQAFLEYASPEVVLLKPESYPIIGKPALKKLYNELSDSSYRLTWKPSFARVSKCGDLGYTFGIYLLETNEARLPEGQGTQKGQIRQGTYCSIWEKNAKDEWRLVLDTGNQGLEESNTN